MEQYIKKSALVAWAKESYLCENASMIRKVCYKQLVEYLDTLDVKEVDLDAEWKRYFEYRGEMATVNVKHLAKHFFELGMQQSKNHNNNEE